MIDDAHLSATRSGYDAIAEACAEPWAAEFARQSLDRAMLGAFAEMVGSVRTDADVLDVGSGPGYVTAHLQELGVRVRGVDLSPAMVELARREHPDIPFDVGEMSALDVPDAGVAGLVAWYSIIHVPRPQVPEVLAEFHRVLCPGGHLLLAFQVGDDTRHRDEAFGHRIALDFHRQQPDTLAGLLDHAGFDLVARLVRAPDPTSIAAKVDQASLIARRR